MLNAIYNIPRDSLRKLILWALGSQTASYDAAQIDKVVAGQ